MSEAQERPTKEQLLNEWLSFKSERPSAREVRAFLDGVDAAEAYHLIRLLSYYGKLEAMTAKPE